MSIGSRIRLGDDSVPLLEEEVAALRAIEAEFEEDGRVAQVGVQALKVHLARLRVSADTTLSKVWELQLDLDQEEVAKDSTPRRMEQAIKS